MRIGFNPNKDKASIVNDFFHQIIVPVYIPNQEDYFKDSFDILKLSLESLFKTTHNKTFFTVVNNGCCQEVQSYLDGLYATNQIQELIHTTNIGKLNAIIKAISGQNFSLITITDADVFFLNNWQKETYAVFNAFPKTGAVSTTPNSKGLRYFTSNIIFDTLFSNKLKFTKVENPDAMKAFAHSIGTPDFFNENHLNKYLTISNGKEKAVLGAGHFVATYRGTIFNNLKQKHTIFSLGGNSENDILDKPVIDNGYWRLSTSDNFTYHMGNTIEDWMVKLSESQKEDNYLLEDFHLTEIKSSKWLNFLKISLFPRIIFKKPIWKLFTRYKGLSKTETNNY